MKIFTRTVVSALLLACVFLLPIVVVAQPIDPCTDPADPCPIDSNVVLLVVAAIGVAAKKAYDLKKMPSAI